MLPSIMGVNSLSIPSLNAKVRQPCLVLMRSAPIVQQKSAIPLAD